MIATVPGLLLIGDETPEHIELAALVVGAHVVISIVDRDEDGGQDPDPQAGMTPEAAEALAAQLLVGAQRARGAVVGVA